MTTDHLDRAAVVIRTELPGLSLLDRLRAPKALDAAGLLVTPKHDAAVAAKALREAADRLNRDRRTHDASCGESPARTKEQAGRDHGVTIGLRQAVRHLDERAAAIERGES